MAGGDRAAAGAAAGAALEPRGSRGISRWVAAGGVGTGAARTSGAAGASEAVTATGAAADAAGAGLDAAVEVGTDGGTALGLESAATVGASPLRPGAERAAVARSAYDVQLKISCVDGEICLEN